MDKIEVSTIEIEGIDHPIYYRPKTVDKSVIIMMVAVPI